jgi:hypothetical protein
MVEVVRPKNLDVYWVVLGIFSGCLISVILFIYGMLLYSSDSKIIFILFGPGYVSVWYSIRFFNLFKSSKLNKISYLYTFLSQLPFWGYAIYSTKEMYASLPDTPPDCFVATASSKSYPFIVGQLIHYKRHSSIKHASKQMIHFWMFEKIWKKHAALSHRYFRIFYNRWGRKLAKHINHPLMASLFFILLKPFEWLALFIIICYLPLNKK